ncbi:hypothetical protein N7490_009439 [Penicillium lividum]|nr:hypothetical protein N7490_009439 [Penicillium lividum]
MRLVLIASFLFGITMAAPVTDKLAVRGPPDVKDGGDGYLDAKLMHSGLNQQLPYILDNYNGP